MILATVIDNIFNHLKNHATLSYIKDWTKGVINLPQQQIYPVINIGFPRVTTNGLTVGIGGRDDNTYTIMVECAFRSEIPEEAFIGTGGDKGIIQCCDDLYQICRGETFSGTFRDPVRVPETNPGIWIDEGGIVFVSQTTLVGMRYDARPR